MVGMRAFDIGMAFVLAAVLVGFRSRLSAATASRLRGFSTSDKYVIERFLRRACWAGAALCASIALLLLLIPAA